MVIHNHEQRSPEWWACRAAKLTGSNALTIATAGKGLETYCYEVLAQKYAVTQEESYSNHHTERGIELEADARILFELQTGKRVTEVGFIERDEYSGASPDGLIEDEKAIIEIKCHQNAKHFKLMVHGEKEIEKGYLYQMHMEMMCARYDHGYYVAYNPNFEKSLLIFKIDKNKDIVEKIEKGIEAGVEILKKIEAELLLNN